VIPPSSSISSTFSPVVNVHVAPVATYHDRY
jgi:hypothetical protein